MEPADLVCCLAADELLTRVPAGTIYSTCSLCKQGVAISPSGQRFLKSDPHIRVICTRCYSPKNYTESFTAAGYENDLAGAQVPNAWRRRN